ncbi:MAG: RHS repeat-associated core domain-containing protein [Fimbriimonadales bacterium]
MAQSGIGTTTYYWNAYDRLTSVTRPSGAESFSYNGVDARVSRTASGTTTTYKRSAPHLTSPVLAEIQGGTTTARYLPGISEKRSGIDTFYHSGIKNTILQTGNATATKRYDAFGNQLASTGIWKGPFSYGGPFGYQTDSGLQLLGDRYYDPSLGRFLNRDRVKDGRNWYTYCANNPLSSADPEGRLLWFVAAGIVLWRAYDAYTTVRDIAEDPTDPMSWVGFIPGSRFAKLLLKKADTVFDGQRKVRGGKELAGKSWTASRENHWKERAKQGGAKKYYGEENVERMKRGRAPQTTDPNSGKKVSMELSHDPVPRRDGGTGFTERWPWEHAEIDPWRHP